MGATMPKASINKNGDALSYKGDIWFPNDAIYVLFPSFHPHSDQHRKQAILKPRSFSLDGSHCLSSVSGVEIVTHSLAKRVAH
jgi:hypothetical protein